MCNDGTQPNLAPTQQSCRLSVLEPDGHLPKRQHPNRSQLASIDREPRKIRLEYLLSNRGCADRVRGVDPTGSLPTADPCWQRCGGPGRILNLDSRASAKRR